MSSMKTEMETMIKEALATVDVELNEISELVSHCWLFLENVDQSLVKCVQKVECYIFSSKKFVIVYPFSLTAKVNISMEQLLSLLCKHQFHLLYSLRRLMRVIARARIRSSMASIMRAIH